MIFLACLAQFFHATTKSTGLQKALMFTGTFLVAVGITGFFGSALSSLGGLNWLGTKFEWPAGYVSGVITTRDGIHVVPHTPSGRIQLYDDNWNFIRGWRVECGGAAFKLVSAQENRIELVGAGQPSRLVYNFEGRLLENSTYAPASFSDYSKPFEAYVVPTKFWLWIFTHPLLSWGTAALGGILLAINHKLGKRRKTAGRMTSKQTQ